MYVEYNGLDDITEKLDTQLKDNKINLEFSASSPLNNLSYNGNGSLTEVSEQLLTNYLDNLSDLGMRYTKLSNKVLIPYLKKTIDNIKTDFKTKQTIHSIRNRPNSLLTSSNVKYFNTDVLKTIKEKLDKKKKLLIENSSTLRDVSYESIRGDTTIIKCDIANIDNDTLLESSELLYDSLFSNINDFKKFLNTACVRNPYLLEYILNSKFNVDPLKLVKLKEVNPRLCKINSSDGFEHELDLFYDYNVYMYVLLKLIEVREMEVLAEDYTTLTKNKIIKTLEFNANECLLKYHGLVRTFKNMTYIPKTNLVCISDSFKDSTKTSTVTIEEILGYIYDLDKHGRSMDNSVSLLELPNPKSKKREYYRERYNKATREEVNVVKRDKKNVFVNLLIDEVKCILSPNKGPDNIDNSVKDFLNTYVESEDDITHEQYCDKVLKILGLSLLELNSEIIKTDNMDSLITNNIINSVLYFTDFNSIIKGILNLDINNEGLHDAIDESIQNYINKKILEHVVLT